MAEMYAELMELNERLHKTVAGKDSVISALVTSLRQAGLEVCSVTLWRSTCVSGLFTVQVPVPVDSLPPEALQPKT